MWRGYPECIYHLCRLLADAGIEDVKPKTLVCVSVDVLHYQREFIESWAEVPLCDSYGQDEHIALITQCPEAGEYHIAMEYGIVEIIKEDGSPAKPGEEGRIVGTGLHNKAFPLIRYDTMDCAVASERTCSTTSAGARSMKLLLESFDVFLVSSFSSFAISFPRRCFSRERSTFPFKGTWISVNQSSLVGVTHQPKDTWLYLGPGYSTIEVPWTSEFLILLDSIETQVTKAR